MGATQLNLNSAFISDDTYSVLFGHFQLNLKLNP